MMLESILKCSAYCLVLMPVVIPELLDPKDVNEAENASVSQIES